MRFSRTTLYAVVFVASTACSKHQNSSRTETPIFKSPKSSEVPASQSTPTTYAPRVVRKVEVHNSDDVQASHTNRKNVAAQLEHILGDAHFPLHVNQWTAVKQVYWSPTFEQPATTIVSDGISRSLPSLKLTSPLALQLAKGAFQGVDDAKEQQSMTALYLLANQDAMNGGHSLPYAFSDRFSDSQVTYGDLVMYEIFSDAFSDVNKSGGVAGDEVAQWVNMASAANPVCRLLALQSFSKVSADQTQQLRFYELYRNELNPEILQTLVQQLFYSANRDAISNLTELQANSSVKNSANLTSKVARAKANMISILFPPTGH